MKFKLSILKQKLPSYEKYAAAALTLVLILLIADTYINPSEDSSVHRLLAVAVMLVASISFRK